MRVCLGIFDSGVGGFSVLKRVIERHGDLPVVYLGDTARVPYGDKEPEEIRHIANEVVPWLCGQGVSTVLVACNTTNSLAMDIVEDRAGVPSLGLIEAAAHMIKESCVGVLATPATAKSNAYQNYIKAMKPKTIVYEKGCPELVPLIESGSFQDKSLRRILELHINPLLKKQVEAIVLGCSHYPFLLPLLRELIPSKIRLIDPSLGLAQMLDDCLGPPKMKTRHPVSFSNTRFFTTSDPNAFASSSTRLLGFRPEVQLVSLTSKPVSSRI